MASTYTSNLQIELITSGEQSGVWGSTTNTNMALLDQAITGSATITMFNANHTLTQTNGASDEARNMILEVVGSNSGIYQIVVPYGTGGAGTGSKMYTVYNNTTGGYAITIGYSGGSTVSIPNGYIATVFGDGTNFFAANTTSAGAFYVNGTLTAAGVADVGNLSVSGTATFSGTTTATTQSPGDSSTKVATTAFVQSVAGGLGTMASQNANSVTITGGSINGVSGTNSSMTVGNATNATNATNVTGTIASGVTATTQTNGDNSTKVATTGYAQSMAIGWSQTWQDVSGSRSLGTTYTNSTGKPIMVSVTTYGGYNPSTSITVGGVLVSFSEPNTNGGNNAYASAQAIVPNGATYVVNGSTVYLWAELR
jgi:hypothetical protein